LILCDSNVLVALVDGRDPLRKRAQTDLVRLSRQPLLVTEPVLSESIFLLPNATHRSRLRDLLIDLNFKLAPAIDHATLLREAFDWLAKYADHTPDWADAHLAILSQHFQQFRIWTYDGEFRSIWRRPDGSRIPLVGKSSP
jgi:predicted nucleic acid-binding protein